MAMVIWVKTLEGGNWPLEINKSTTMGEIRTKLVYFSKAADYALDSDGALICFYDCQDTEKTHDLDDDDDPVLAPERPWKTRRMQRLEAWEPPPCRRLTAENLAALVGEEEKDDIDLLAALYYAHAWEADWLPTDTLYEVDSDTSGGSTYRALKQSVRAADAEAWKKEQWLFDPYFPVASDASDDASWASSSWGPYVLAGALASVRESFSLVFRGRYLEDSWTAVQDVGICPNDVLDMVPKSWDTE